MIESWTHVRRLTLAAFAVGALVAAPARAEDAARLIRSALDHAADHAAKAAPRDGARDEDVKRFYELHHFRPAWSAQTAAAAESALDRAATEGLIATEYQHDGAARPSGGKAGAAWDIQLTRAFLHYAKDVRIGRLIPGQVDEDIALPAQSFDAATALEAALGAAPARGQDSGSFDAFVAGLPPQRPEYAFLRAALAHYRDLDARGDWRVSALAGEPLKSLAPEVRDKLIHRLGAGDQQSPANADNVSEAVLQNAVRRFQARFGLEPTGRLTAETVKVLNQPVSDRILQIEANMERWRWLPRDPGPRYIEVNIPDETLKVVDDGHVILTSPVVLGSNDWATPLLAATAQAVVVNPPWHVPPDMAGEEILPKLIHDPSYLAAHDMVLLNGPQNDPHGRTISWRDVPAAPFPYLIQQQPGPRNGLGALLIDMPNDFGVYLHDTPDKELFSRTNRALSHGCVRVRDIAAVASFALFGDTRHAGRIPRPPRTETQRIALDRPLPVYMLYWTAFEDAGDKKDTGGAGGTVAFRRDAYGLDVRVVAALYGRTGVAAARPATVAQATAGKSLSP